MLKNLKMIYRYNINKWERKRKVVNNRNYNYIKILNNLEIKRYYPGSRDLSKLIKVKKKEIILEKIKNNTIIKNDLKSKNTKVKFYNSLCKEKNFFKTNQINGSKKINKICKKNFIIDEKDVMEFKLEELEQILEYQDGLKDLHLILVIIGIYYIYLGTITKNSKNISYIEKENNEYIYNVVKNENSDILITPLKVYNKNDNILLNYENKKKYQELTINENVENKILENLSKIEGYRSDEEILTTLETKGTIINNKNLKDFKNLENLKKFEDHNSLD